MTDTDPRTEHEAPYPSGSHFNPQPCEVTCCDEQQNRHVHEGTHRDHTGDGEWCIDCDVVIGKAGPLRYAAEHSSGSPQTEAGRRLLGVAYLAGDAESEGVNLRDAITAIEREAAARREGPVNSRQAQPLDVERLARALRVSVHYGAEHPDQYRRTVAEKIAAEYLASIPEMTGTARHAAWCWLPLDHQGMCEGDQ